MSTLPSFPNTFSFPGGTTVNTDVKEDQLAKIAMLAKGLGVDSINIKFPKSPDNLAITLYSNGKVAVASASKSVQPAFDSWTKRMTQEVTQALTQMPTLPSPASTTASTTTEQRETAPGTLTVAVSHVPGSTHASDALGAVAALNRPPTQVARLRAARAADEEPSLPGRR